MIKRIGARLVLVLVMTAGLMVLSGIALGTDDEADIDAGRELFLISCSTCHGIDGEGGIGPDLDNAGAAETSFMLTTGRMPLANPNDQAVRKPVAFTDEEIDQLVAYVASLGNGTPIPDVDASRGQLNVGSKLFLENCAACHSSAGAGGALPHGRHAPTLHHATAQEVGEAIRIGPGEMPLFSENFLTQSDVDSIAAYVLYLQEPETPGGLPLGLRGPVTEGVISWVVGLTLLVGATMWIERFRVKRRER